MKYCPKCKKGFDTEEKTCPICGEKLLNWQGDDEESELDAGQIVAVMTTLGLF